METTNLPELITGLTSDSRAVRPGYVFAALPGARVDGRQFIPEALDRGAVTIIAPPGTDWPLAERPYGKLEVGNPRKALAELAAAFHAAQPERIVAVTGTNGKSSVARFVEQIWAHLGLDGASLGTLGLSPDHAQPMVMPASSLTTPDPVELHRLLAHLCERGFDRLAMEASSHGLDQYRLDGVRLKAAAFTNLSQDHLDYHGEMEAYFAAKARLFTELLPAGAAAIINNDDPYGRRLVELADARGLSTIGYGEAGPDLKLVRARPVFEGLELEIEVFGENHRLDLPLLGRFQAMNALAALGLVLAVEEAEIGRAVDALRHLRGVPGRLELVGAHAGGARVYVDYAHTPEALAAMLVDLRAHVAGRLTVVFGAGGNRDAAKRPLMGQAATAGADRVIVTDDNPRHEDPASIRAAIMAACPQAEEIGEREAAIRAGLEGLGNGDALVVAGKGHELGQIVGDETLPFNDAEIIRALLAETAA